MAGDWIKMEHVTQSKPELFCMASELGVSRDEVLGMLVRFWVWADQQSVSGKLKGMTARDIDAIVGVEKFTTVLQKANWIALKGDVFVLKNFPRHNGKSAKRRALDRKRQSAKRHAPKRTKSGLEKRREEKSKEEEARGEKVTWNGTTFHVPESVLGEFCDRWPNITREAIKAEIADAAVWSIGEGRKHKAPRTFLQNTWLKRAFAGTSRPPDPQQEAIDAAEIARGKRNARILKELSE